MNKKRIIFLVSGNGGTLKFLKEAITNNNFHLEIAGVIGDRECEAINYAKQNKIPNYIIHYNKTNTHSLQEALNKCKPDLIITNIHKIIDPETLNLYKDKFINLHYSLLPAFSGMIGMETIKAAKVQNVQFIGATCHEVSEEVDAGKILVQGCFTVDWLVDETVIIDTVYQTACLCILKGIMFKFKLPYVSKVTRKTINGFEVFFSPDLSFNINLSNKAITE